MRDMTAQTPQTKTEAGIEDPSARVSPAGDGEPVVRPSVRSDVSMGQLLVIRHTPDRCDRAYPVRPAGSPPGFTRRRGGRPRGWTFAVATSTGPLAVPRVVVVIRLPRRIGHQQDEVREGEVAGADVRPD